MKAANQMRSPAAERIAYGLKELAQLLGLRYHFLWTETRRGNLLSTRIGRKLIVTKIELDRYLATHTATARNSKRTKRNARAHA
jgi:hypothetical protein